MFSPDELVTLRRAYARQILFTAGVDNADLETAFAHVLREAYLGPGPWPIANWSGGYRRTPDADPAWLYADLLVGIVPERGLNNGQPSAHALWIAAADPQPGDHIVHLGAGIGYYSAILGELAGPKGALTAIELDPDLAARAAANLASLGHARVLAGDGCTVDFAPADVIYVNAGAARPLAGWLDRLKDGGRLLIPLTTGQNFALRPAESPMPSGAMFRITRRGADFAADFIGPIAIFPCAGARDDASEQALAAGFAKRGYRNVKRLRLGDDVPDEECWVKAPGWALTYR
jgi:protein-L-isoaspartate(D-aspartate) O-methyltransferase